MSDMLDQVHWLNEVATEWASGTRFKSQEFHTSCYLSDDDGSEGPLSDLTQMRVWCDHGRIEWSATGQWKNGTWWYEDTVSEDKLKKLMRDVLDEWLVVTGAWQGVLLAFGFEFITYKSTRWSDEVGGFVLK